MIRVIASAALGALLGGVVLALVGPSSVGQTIALVALPVLILTSVLILIARSTGRMIGASPAAVQQARDARRLGIARIDALRQTGTQINDQPLCELDLTVQPLSGAAYSTTGRTIVPLTAIPMFQAGSEREVAILLDGGPEVAFIDGGDLSPAERARLSVPSRATAPFILPEKHVRIVNGKRQAPLLGVGKRGRGLRIAVFVAAAVVAAAIVIVPYHHSIEQGILALQDGRLRPDLRRPDALADAREALEAEIGHDRVVQVIVAEDFVVVDAPLRPGDTKTDQWTYRDGEVMHGGGAPSQPDSAAEQFAWSAVSLDRLWPLLEEASAQVDLPITDSTVRIARGSDGNIDSPTFGQSVAAPTIGFSLGDDYGSTFFRANADGSQLTAS
ncbi:hypothetical protein [Okibacterium fritillariae]|uniref:Uncharacterized protein n=1 Tax=Okibacterium fritillariae TaxID=123320 RepID=A0A1T5IYC2_9MICO|nr:hypothetical protein [Okibacterium fritillariae]SKC43928.1 hypothetical protein SAMN06309945_0970 [Okibacterium fritillariae]